MTGGKAIGTAIALLLVASIRGIATAVRQSVVLSAQGRTFKIGSSFFEEIDMGIGKNPLIKEIAVAVAIKLALIVGLYLAFFRTPAQPDVPEVARHLTTPASQSKE